MAWSWSHTTEAYHNAEQNIANLSDEKVAEIWAEWNACEDAEQPELDNDRYERMHAAAMERIREGRRDELEEEIWGKASELATCTNGGHEAWLCPFGCGCHMVSFDKED